MIIRIALILVLSCLLVSSREAGRVGRTQAQAVSGEATIFAEGVISTAEYESHSQFTPDGKVLYFVKSTPNFSFWTIALSRLENGKWSAPEVAPFSGQYSDADPFITPDGSRLFFISNRPAPGKTGRDLDIWVMEKTDTGWSEPRNPGPPVNSPGNEWFPTATNDGTLYFGSDREGGKGRTDIYRCPMIDRKYSGAENLGENINSPFGEFEPYIAPDESYLIFAAAGRQDGKGQFDLYLSHRREGAWTKAVNLGDKINTAATEFAPKVSPDGKTFFFTSTRGFADDPLTQRMNYQELSKRLKGTRNGLGDIYQIDIKAVGIQ
jgi:Tol biopolymer transport system component